MKIKRGPVAFHNLLKMRDTCKGEGWQLMARLMRDYVVMNGLYTNAPAFYQVQDVPEDAEKHEYTVYVPVNAPVVVPEDVPMGFVAELVFEDSLMFRVFDPDTPLEQAYMFLDECARQQGYGLVRPFYHVCYEVFGDTVVDVIAPIVEEGQDGHAE